MSGGSGSTTSTGSWSPPPEVLQNYQDVVGLAKQAQQQPFTPYGGEMVAGLSPTQEAGIQNVNQTVGMAQPFIQQGVQNIQGGQYAAQPYYDAATGSIQGGISAANPLQQQAQYGIQNALGYASPYQNMATGLSLQAAQGIMPQEFSQGAVNQYMSPYMNNVVSGTMNQLANQQAQQRSALQGQAISAGAFGGDRAGIAQAELANQQNLASGQILGNLLQSGYGQALSGFQQQQGVNLAAQQANRAAQAAAAGQLSGIGQQGYAQQLGAAQQQGALGQQLFGQGMTTAQQQAALGQGLYNMGLGGGQAIAGLGTQAQQAGLQGAQAQLAAGAQQQAYQQALDQALMGQFQQQQAYPFQSTQYLANIVEGIGAGSGGTSTTTQPGPNIMSQVFGGLGALGLIASDPRVKDNMEPVGKTFDGQNIYKFNYKGDPTTRIGFNAAETEQHKPEAVHNVGGLRAVNYDVATKDAAEKGHFAQGGVASLGGGVTPSMDRQAYPIGGGVDGTEISNLIQQLYGKANPGIGMIPYGQQSATPYGSVHGYMPVSKIPVGKSTIPNPPPGYQDNSTDDVLKQLQSLKGFTGTGGLAGGLNKLNNLLPVGSRFGDVANLYDTPAGPFLPTNYAQGGLVGYREHHDGTDGNVVSTQDSTQDQPQYKIQPQNVEDMDPISQMVVRTIYHGESGGKYNILNGGETFDNTQGHPNKIGTGGESTAAGAGQFIKSTWDNVTGGAPMTKPYQDAATIELAKSDYKKRTGNDLLSDIQENGFSPEIRAALAPTFTSLGPKQGVAGAAKGDQSGVAAANQRTILENILGRDLDPNAKSALLAGFLGVMASPSPYFGTALGQGGLGAVQNYMSQQQLQRENALANLKLQQEQQRIGLEGQKYGLEAKQFGLQLYKNLDSQYRAQYVDDGKGGFTLQYLNPQGLPLTQAQYAQEKMKNMQMFGLTPKDLGESAEPAASAAVKTAKDTIQAGNYDPLTGTVRPAMSATAGQSLEQKDQTPVQTAVKQGASVQPTSNDALSASIKAQQDRYNSLMAEYDSVRKNAASMTLNPEQQKTEYARAQDIYKTAQEALAQTFPTPNGNIVRLQPNGPAYINPPPKPIDANTPTGKVNPNNGVLQTAIPDIGYPLTGGHPTESLPAGVTRTAPDPNLTISQKTAEDQEKELQDSVMKTKDAIPSILKFSSAMHFIEGGGLSSKKEELANQARGFGLNNIADQIDRTPAGAWESNTAKMQQAIKTSVSNAVAQVSSNFARPTQSEFNVTEQKATPNIDQENPASLSLAETQLAGTLYQNKLWADWNAEKQKGSKNFAAFQQNWKTLNKRPMFEDAAQAILGNFKGMPLPDASKMTEGTVYVMPKNPSAPMSGYDPSNDPNKKIYDGLLASGIKPGEMFVFNGVKHGEDGSHNLGKATKIEGSVVDVYKQMLKHPALVYGG